MEKGFKKEPNWVDKFNHSLGVEISHKRMKEILASSKAVTKEEVEKILQLTDSVSSIPTEPKQETEFNPFLVAGPKPRKVDKEKLSNKINQIYRAVRENDKTYASSEPPHPVEVCNTCGRLDNEYCSNSFHLPVKSEQQTAEEKHINIEDPIIGTFWHFSDDHIKNLRGICIERKGEVEGGELFDDLLNELFSRYGRIDGQSALRYQLRLASLKSFKARREAIQEFHYAIKEAIEAMEHHTDDFAVFSSLRRLKEIEEKGPKEAKR